MRKNIVLASSSANVSRFLVPLLLLGCLWSYSGSAVQPETKKPAVSQDEVDQMCGPLCLYLLCHYHDVGVDFATLRDLLPPGPNGVSLLSLKTVAEKLRFETRCLEMEAQHLNLFRSPMIVRVPSKDGEGSTGHFLVVLPSPDDGGSWIFDPAKPSAKWKWAHVEEQGDENEHKRFAALLLSLKQDVAREERQPEVGSVALPSGDGAAEEANAEE